MIRRGKLIFHFGGGRILIINRIDRVYRKIASCRLVEIFKKTGNSYRDSETNLK